jgi:GntR family transcriptional repressor for pyruvate dehydrogenase complex
MFEHVVQQKYYMQIARQIRNSIRDGKLTIGEKLPPERTLAQQFGASRASIREALSALEMLGLIECKSGQGNFIKADGSEGTIDGELLKALLIGHDPFEILEARLELEPNLAGLAAERATKKEKAALQRIVEALDSLSKQITALEDPAVEEYLEEDRKFHLHIGRSAHNNVLFTVYSGVNLMMKETHWQALKSEALLIEGNLQKYAQEHHNICDAIIEGDAEGASAAMRSHIAVLQEDIF